MVEVLPPVNLAAGFTIPGFEDAEPLKPQQNSAAKGEVILLEPVNLADSEMPGGDQLPPIEALVNDPTVWLETDVARLRAYLPRSELSAVCRSLRRRFPPSLAGARGLRRLEQAGELATAAASASSAEVQALDPVDATIWKELEIWYVFAPDWEVRSHELQSKKGTWVKGTTAFSWEQTPSTKLYLAPGVVMPVATVANVIGEEKTRHAWSEQHKRVWLKPAILKELWDLQNAWYFYAPHFAQRGDSLVALQDTFLKRTCQMSWDLRDFEKVAIDAHQIMYVSDVKTVTEPWEVKRHAHVDQHRRAIFHDLITS